MLIGCWGSRWCLSPSCLRSGGEESALEVFRGGVGLSAPHGKWHDDDDFDRSLPPRWTRVPRQRPRWVVRPKSVFSDGRDLVDRDVNCRPLDWKYDNFPVQEMAPRNLGRSHLKFYSSNDCETNLLDKLVTIIPARGQNKTAHFYKQQLKTWFRAGPRPWILSDGTIYGTEMKTSPNFLVQWPWTRWIIKYYIGFLHGPDSSYKNCIHTTSTLIFNNINAAIVIDERKEIRKLLEDGFLGRITMVKPQFVQRTWGQ